MAVIRSSDHPELLDIPLNEVFHLFLSESEPEYTTWCNVQDLDMAFDDSIKVSEFGSVPQKPEGGLFQFENIESSDPKRITPVEFGLGYVITRKMRDDDRHGVMVNLTTALRRSFRDLFEKRCARILNNATSTSAEFLGLDGKSLLHTAHPLMGGGTQSNRSATDADLSSVSVENAVLNFASRVRENNQPTDITPRMAIVPVGDQFDAARIFRNAMKFNTANNENNWVRVGPDNNGVSEYLPSRYLADSDRWFMVTDKAEHDAVLKVIVNPEFQVGSDFRSDNFLARGYARMESGFYNYHYWYGSLGTGG